MIRVVSWALALTVLSPSFLTAQITESRGTATVTFRGPEICQTDRATDRQGRPVPDCLQPSAAEIQEAQLRAALQAVERFVAEGGASAAQAFARVRETVAGSLEDIVLSIRELNSTTDPSSRQFTVTVRVEINDARLRLLLQEASAVGQASTAEKSLLGLFMLAREQASVEMFSPEQQASNSTSKASSIAASSDVVSDIRERESIGNGAVIINDSTQLQSATSVTSESQSVQTSSGSTVLRADRVEYVVAPAQDLEAVLGGRLSSVGFETVEAAFLEDEQSPGLLETVRSDFGTGDDLQAATLRRIAGAARINGVGFVLVGTVDLGFPDVDPVTGNQRVFAKVSAKVYDVAGRLPRTVVNVGPAQFAGLGPDAGVAKTNALKEAAEETARAVIDQMSNRSIR